MARQQTRTYTCELQRIKAIWFKPLFSLTSNQQVDQLEKRFYIGLDEFIRGVDCFDALFNL